MKTLLLASLIAIAFTSTSVVKANECPATIIEDVKEVVYVEIANDSVPAELTKIIKGVYPESTISKTFKGDDGSFKFELKEGETSKTVISSAEGKLEEIE